METFITSLIISMMFMLPSTGLVVRLRRAHAKEGCEHVQCSAQLCNSAQMYPYDFALQHMIYEAIVFFCCPQNLLCQTSSKHKYQV